MQLIDQSGKNNHGKFIGNVNIDPVLNNINAGLTFTQGQNIRLPAISLSYNKDFTISYWIKMPATSVNFFEVLSYRNYRNTPIFSIQMDKNDTKNYQISVWV